MARPEIVVDVKLTERTRHLIKDLKRFTYEENHMPKFKPYIVAVIEQPTPEREEAGDPPRIVHAPSLVMAKDENSARVFASIDASKQKDVEVSRLEVLVRPF